MYAINREKFDQTMNELVACVRAEQENMRENGEQFDGDAMTVTLHNGWLWEQEGYKREIFDKARKILELDSKDLWNKDKLHELNLIDRVVKCIRMKVDGLGTQNLLHWTQTQEGKGSLKNLLCQTPERSEEVLFQIFHDDGGNREESEERAFNQAIDLWGRKYPFLSFLFFLKDRDRFVPIRPVVFKHNCERFGISSECFNTCSWNNYQEFISILREVQGIVKENVDPDAELIDAHSFIWAEWFLEKKEKESQIRENEEAEKEFDRHGVVGRERDAHVRVRENQGTFRKIMLNRYDHCCLCDVRKPELLIASHIKPWSMSDPSEKIDVDNGFLLCPNHDRLFDGGWITVKDNGSVIKSEMISLSDMGSMTVPSRVNVGLTSGNKKYLAFHRENIFKEDP